MRAFSGFVGLSCASHKSRDPFPNNPKLGVSPSPVNMFFKRILVIHALFHLWCVATTSAVDDLIILVWFVWSFCESLNGPKRQELMAHRGPGPVAPGIRPGDSVRTKKAGLDGLQSISPHGNSLALQVWFNRIKVSIRSQMMNFLLFASQLGCDCKQPHTASKIRISDWGAPCHNVRTQTERPDAAGAKDSTWRLVDHLVAFVDLP